MEKLLVSYQGRKIYNPSLGREVEIKNLPVEDRHIWSGSRELLIPYLPMLLGTAVFNVKKAPHGSNSVTAGEKKLLQGVFSGDD